jgi:hypothetical protein
MKPNRSRCKSCDKFGNSDASWIKHGRCHPCRQKEHQRVVPEIYSFKLRLIVIAILALSSLALIVLSIRVLLDPHIEIPYPGARGRGIIWRQFNGMEVLIQVMALWLIITGLVARLVNVIRSNQRISSKNTGKLMGYCFGGALLLYLISIFIGHRMS